MHCRARFGQQPSREVLRATASFERRGERRAARELWRRWQRRGRRPLRQSEGDTVDANTAHIFSSEQRSDVFE